MEETVQAGILAVTFPSGEEGEARQFALIVPLPDRYGIGCGIAGQDG